jgi:addiction module RelE/StbE family toxin
MKLRWTAPAIRQLHAIHAYIAADNPAAADRTVALIRASLQRIALLPYSGRSGRRSGTRELVIPATTYLAAYRIANDEVHVLAILHGAQDWPPQL